MTEASSSPVNLLDLAASTVASSVSASISIRGFSRLNGKQDDIKNTRLKADGSCVTDADFAAQCLITQAVQRISKNIRILGEENPEGVAKQVVKTSKELDERVYCLARKEIYMRYKSSLETGTNDTIDKSTCLPLSSEQQTTDSSAEEISLPDDVDQTKYLVDPSRVSVIIDPLDGTKAFANSEYDAVSILIAIVLDRDPCFGVICKPFGYKGLTSILDTGCAAVYGGTLLGDGYVAGGPSCFLKVEAKEGSDSTSALPRAVISSSRSKGVVLDVCQQLGSMGVIHPEPMHISGAGEKSLRLILRHHNEGLWFFPKKGTSLWDVAASDALLRVSGGKITDKFGRDLDYTKSRDNAENVDGVIACYDSKLHSECLRIFQEGEWDDG